MFVLFTVNLFVCLAAGRSTKADNDPDAFRNASQLITSKGYPFEEHLVQTPDGYILGIHRIPPRNHRKDVRAPVVLLQHGLLSCSSCWVENSVTQSLGFMLSDKGMDVWLGNSRGNTYSKRHTSYKPTDPGFWDFSWDDMAKYDLPATVDHILKVTNSTYLYYGGHSQGTEIAFAELGRNKTLASKIKHFFVLAPVATLGDIGGAFKAFAPYAQDVGMFFELLGKDEFLPSSALIQTLGREYCNSSLQTLICENVLFLLGGYDFKALNASRIPVYVHEHPAGTSVKNMLHYAQSILSKKFQMFDYGSPTANMQHYNQSTPPLYDVTQMKNNISLYTGGNDILADPEDVRLLVKMLPNIYRHTDISYYEHLDFIWAIDANRKVYDDIISTILSYESKK